MRRPSDDLCPDPQGARFLFVVFVIFLTEVFCIVGGWWLLHRGGFL
jgi:hypothetical protein